jgi:hypothetical protein
VLTLDFEKRENNIGHKGYLIGGYASPFATGREKLATRFRDPIKQNTDHSLSIHIGLQMIYDESFRKISFDFGDFERTHLFKKVHSVLSHELNHLYEYYKRKNSGSDNISLSLTWTTIDEENFYEVPQSIFRYWQLEFTDYIYVSEPHEINAQVQESKTEIDRSIFEKFRKSKYWKELKKNAILVKRRIH